MILPAFDKNLDAKDLDLLMEQARKASDLRLVILCLLSEGEKSVSELEEILTMPQAAVSQQLARLRLEGLVQSRRDGRMIYSSLMNDEVSSIISSLYELFCKDVRAPEK